MAEPDPPRPGAKRASRIAPEIAVTDVEVSGAAAVPDRVADRPPNWIDPSLLSDELDDLFPPAALPPARDPAVEENPELAARPCDDSALSGSGPPAPAVEAPPVEAPPVVEAPLGEVLLGETPMAASLADRLAALEAEDAAAGESDAGTPLANEVSTVPPGPVPEPVPEKRSPPLGRNPFARLATPLASDPAPLRDLRARLGHLATPAARLPADPAWEGTTSAEAGLAGTPGDDVGMTPGASDGIPAAALHEPVPSPAPPPGLSLDERLAAIEREDEDDASAREVSTHEAAATPPLGPAATCVAGAPAPESAHPESGGAAAALAQRLEALVPPPARPAREHHAEDILERSQSEQDAPPPRMVSASRAVFAAHPALSLVSAGPERGPAVVEAVDPLNDPIAAFAGLAPGQAGMICLSMRAYPEFRGESGAWVGAMRTGQEVRPPSRGKRVSALLGYLGRLMVHHSQPSPTAPPPAPPWKKAEVKPLASAQMDDETRQSLRDAEMKARDVAHFESRLYVAVMGEREDAANLEVTRQSVEIAFGGYHSIHQRLAWEPTPAWDAMIGLLPARPDSSLALSAAETGALARPFDTRLNPHGVAVARARIKPLPLASPLIIPEPLNPPKGMVPIGVLNPDSDDEMTIGVGAAQLDQHMFICGRTGTGKSSLLHWVLFGLAKADYPIILVDPHGALVDDVAAIIIKHAPERIDDLVILDADKDFPMALNPLDISDREQIEPSVGAVKEMFAHFAFDGGSAPRAMTYLEQALTVLSEANTRLKDPDTKCTLLQVATFFSDPEFRRLALELCTNPSILEAYDPDHGAFELLSERQQVEHTMPIRRVIDRLGNSDSFGNVFGSPANRVDFPRLINGRKIVLIKLARFAQQRELGAFVGRLIVPWMLQSMNIWGRQRDPYTGEYTGSGCRLIVDEAPTLFGPGSSAIQVLAEARKYDFGLVSVAQFPTQFPTDVQQAMYSNTASKISLALDPGGVGGIARSLAGDSPLLTPNDIVALPNYVGYANLLLAHGDMPPSTSGPFAMYTPRPFPRDLSPAERRTLDEVIARSHDMICNPRDEIETKRRRLLEDLKTALRQVVHDENKSELARGDAPAIDLDLDAEGDGEWGFSWNVPDPDEFA